VTDPADIPTNTPVETHQMELESVVARIGPMLQREFGLIAGQPTQVDRAWIFKYGATLVGVDAFIADPDIPPTPPTNETPQEYEVPDGTHPDAHDIAQSFHETYEFLAPQHGYKTREKSAVRWADVPTTNKALMVATVDALLKIGLVVRGSTVAAPVPPASERFPQLQFTPTPEDLAVIESLRQHTGLATTEEILAGALAFWQDHRTK
jgi:hypothetical protein